MAMHRGIVCIVLAAAAWAWVSPGAGYGDTLYLANGEEMEGLIHHVEMDGDKIDYIRFESRGVFMNIPGKMIDFFEDIPEPTDTPEATATTTATPTRTPRPTWTPLPRPSPTPFTPMEADTRGEWSPGETVDIEEVDEWTGLLPGEGDTGFEGEMPSEVFGEDYAWLDRMVAAQMEGKYAPVTWVANLCLIAAWIICIVDGFRQSAGTGILVLIFGAPCCCCVNFIFLIIYSATKYSGEKKTIPLWLSIGYPTFVVVYWLLTFMG